MADSSDIDAALVQKLLGDATLSTLMPDGVFFDQAAPGATRFVLVSLLDAADESMFGRRAFETPTYLVKAVALSTSGGNVKAAAARIDALLEQGSLAVAGYSVTNLRRTERIRIREVSEDDASLYWDHRGGHYEVMASPS
jgi:hypothetical protein